MPPVWRVRRKDDPDLWLRSFTCEGEARNFARQHAIQHGCSMVIEVPSEAELADWMEF